MRTPRFVLFLWISVLLAGLGLLVLPRTARAVCDPASGPCEPGEKARRATRTPTRPAPFLVNSTPVCLNEEQFKVCIGNPACNGIPRCPTPPPPTATFAPSPTPSLTPTITLTPVATLTAVATATRVCLDDQQWKVCVGNPACNGIPRCPSPQTTTPQPLGVQNSPSPPTSGWRTGWLAAGILLVVLLVGVALISRGAGRG